MVPELGPNNEKFRLAFDCTISGGCLFLTPNGLNTHHQTHPAAC